MSKLNGGSLTVRAALADSRHRSRHRGLAIRGALITAAAEEHDEAEADEELPVVHAHEPDTVEMQNESMTDDVPPDQPADEHREEDLHDDDGNAA